MSVAPSGGLVGSVAGTPVAQTKGSEVERDQRESAAQAREVDLFGQSERAQGVGQTAQDHEISERDADGRRPWETTSRTPEDHEASVTHDPLQSKDVAGTSGNQLDVTG
jgi:hypothetical protein